MGGHFAYYLWLSIHPNSEFCITVVQYGLITWIITGQPTNCVGGQYCFYLWRLSHLIVIRPIVEKAEISSVQLRLLYKSACY